MTDDVSRLQDALREADDDLDCAWSSGVGIEEALQRAKWLSGQIGRDPVIEDAKLAVARELDCDPATGFAVLSVVSQRTNRRVCEVAHDVVARTGARSAVS